MNVRGVLAAFALVLCATTAPATSTPAGPTRASNSEDPFTEFPPITATPTKHFGPPVASSEAWPWKIGQWVAYKRQDGSGIALEQLRIVAQDACGFWIERWIHQNGARTTWLFCVRAQPAPDDLALYQSLWAVIERHNRQVVLAEDFRVGTSDRSRYGWLVSLVHAPWVGRTDLPREDAATPVGVFEQAAKAVANEGGGELTRWSHPAVPLGGTVKESTSDYERVLVGFGSSTGSSPIVDVVSDLELAQRSFREVNGSAPWVALRTGFDSLGTMGDVNRTFSFGSSFGFPVASAFDVAVSANTVGAASSSMDATLEESLLLISGGVRWYPLGRSRAEPFGTNKHARLYVQGDLGFANLWRTRSNGDESTVGRGVAVGARAGFNLAQGRDWTLGMDVHDDVVLLNADEGLRHSFGVQAFVQLFTKPSRYTLP